MYYSQSSVAIYKYNRQDVTSMTYCSVAISRMWVLFESNSCMYMYCIWPVSLRILED